MQPTKTIEKRSHPANQPLFTTPDVEKKREMVSTKTIAEWERFSSQSGVALIAGSLTTKSSAMLGPKSARSGRRQSKSGKAGQRFQTLQGSRDRNGDPLKLAPRPRPPCNKTCRGRDKKRVKRPGVARQPPLSG